MAEELFALPERRPASLPARCLLLLLFLLLRGVDPASGQAQPPQALPPSGGNLSLEGRIFLPNRGRVERKIQIPGLEEPRRPSGTAERIPESGFYESVEMEPLLFLQLAGSPRNCLVAFAPGGRFAIQGLSPGTYRLTFAIPDFGSMEKSLLLDPDPSGNTVRRFEFRFEPEGEVVLRAEREPVPGEAAAAFTRGAEALERGELEVARNAFGEALDAAPGFAEAWEYLGIVRKSESDLAEAERCFRMSLENDPNSCPALEYLGTILLLRGDLEEAGDLLRRAVRIRPGDPFARTQLGTVLYHRQELSSSLDQLVKARALDPRHHSQPQLMTAEVFRVLRDRESAALELADFIANFPDDPKVPTLRRVLEAIPWQ